MADNPFVGVWSLQSFEVRTFDDQVSYPFGREVDGYLIYTPDGYMSVTFMQRGRPNFLKDDWLDGSAEERSLAYHSCLAYCGRYEILADRVIHHIEFSQFPNWTGRDQVRFYHFAGDLLTLSSPALLLEGAQQTARLVWKRCG